MDILALIREKREEFAALRTPDGIDAVIHHLEVARRHFHRARDEGDTDLFTDVVYRTNHAFEGILKEAYQILAGQDAATQTPHAIERYLERNDILHSRVLDQFTHYRQNWRNPSTHDYQLYFEEQEALLAIASVSGFCYVALHQMLQAVAAQHALALDMQSQQVERLLHDPDLSNVEFAEQLSTRLATIIPSLLADFSQRSEARISEAMLQGALMGVLRSEAGRVALVAEPSLTSEGVMFRPDVMLHRDNESIIIELKSTGTHMTHIARRKRELLEQLRTYMHAGQSRIGIGIIFSAGIQPEGIPEYSVEHRISQNQHQLIVSPVESNSHRLTTR